MPVNNLQKRRFVLGLILSGALLGGILSPVMKYSGKTQAAENNPQRASDLFQKYLEEKSLEEGQAAENQGQRMINLFQASALGREFYAFAQRTGARIEFKRGFLGYYSPGGKLVSIHTDFSDLVTPVLMAHELRHHWQFETIGPARNLSPAQAFRLSQLQEGDACAFAARYADTYEKEAGRRLSATKVHPQVADYFSAPENERDYLQGAFIPCLAISNDGKGYSEIHLVREEFRMKDLARHFNEAVEAGDRAKMQLLYDTEFINPDKASELALYRKFFTQDSDPLHTIPALRAMNDGDFSRLLDRIAPIPASPKLGRLENNYRTMKRRLKYQLGGKPGI